MEHSQEFESLILELNDKIMIRQIGDKRTSQNRNTKFPFSKCSLIDLITFHNFVLRVIFRPKYLTRQQSITSAFQNPRLPEWSILATFPNSILISGGISPREYNCHFSIPDKMILQKKNNGIPNRSSIFILSIRGYVHFKVK